MSDDDLLRQHYKLSFQLNQIQIEVQRAMATVDQLIADGTPSRAGGTVQGWVDLDGDYWHADPDRPGWAAGYTGLNKSPGLFQWVNIDKDHLIRWYGPLTPIYN